MMRCETVNNTREARWQSLFDLVEVLIKFNINAQFNVYTKEDDLFVGRSTLLPSYLLAGMFQDDRVKTVYTDDDDVYSGICLKLSISSSTDAEHLIRDVNMLAFIVLHKKKYYV